LRPRRFSSKANKRSEKINRSSECKKEDPPKVLFFPPLVLILHKTVGEREEVSPSHTF
jgi:hypothetical protein